MDYDVIVVGGGPVGCFTAAGIARSCFKVLVVEEHKNIGEPVQCAGLVSPRTMALASAPKDLIIKEYSSSRIISSLGSELSITGEKVFAQAVDRAAFDRHLAGQTREAGAEIITDARVTGITRMPAGFRVNINTGKKQLNLTCRLLIGADGVKSRVAKWLGLPPASSRVNMYAGDIELNSINPEEVLVFLGQSIAPGWFGWVIPLTDRLARVGVGSLFNDRSPRYYFKNMADHFPSIFRGYKEIRYAGGAVPFGLMKKIYSSHAMLVGDAAAQVKPMSGGGIYTGLRGANVCSMVACEALNRDHLSDNYLSEYQMLWESEFRSEFQSSIMHREVYSNMSDRDLDNLLRFLNRPRWRRLIARYGDIDYPSWLARHLFSAGPWLQRFAFAALDLFEARERVRSRIEA